MKLFNIVLRSACLITCSLVLASIAPVMAADATTQGTSNYQSSFDDYKPLTDDSLSDWKAINAQSNGSGHAGHSMHGMQHEMTPEQMANMSPPDKEMPAMEGMEQSGMQEMDHIQMKHEHAMAPMEGMDHSKMAGMSQVDMKAMPSNAAPAMQPIDDAQMQGMSHDKTPSHDHSKSTMGARDHSMGDSSAGEMQHNHDEAMSDEMAPHEHGSEHGSEHAAEQGHEHSEMKMPLNQPTTATAPPSHWQIIPNLHPMIVHFPIALTLIAFLLSFAAYVRRTHPVSAQLAAAGHFTLWLAALGAATAVLFGWLAYNSVNHDDAGHAAMLLHRAWAVPTTIGLILLASWDAWKYRVNELMSVPALILLFALSETVAVTGWLGGELVYRHGIGVLSLPVSEGVSHSHHHHDHDGADSTAHAHDTTEATPDEHTEHHHDDEKGESHEH